MGSPQAGDLPTANSVASISKNGEAETLARPLNAIGKIGSAGTPASALYSKQQLRGNEASKWFDEICPVFCPMGSTFHVAPNRANMQSCSVVCTR